MILFSFSLSKRQNTTVFATDIESVNLLLTPRLEFTLQATLNH